MYSNWTSWSSSNTPTPTQPLAVIFKAALFRSDTAGALLDWCRVGPAMGSPGAFPHYYHCTDTERFTQVVVMLWTEHAGRCVFVVSVFTLGPSNWGKWNLLLTQLETEGAWDGKRSLWGTLFVVMGLAWFLSQLKTKIADKQTHTHIHTKMHTHLLHSYFMFKSWSSTALLPTQWTHCCQTHFNSHPQPTHYTTAKNVPRHFLEWTQATNCMTLAFLCLFLNK